MIHAGHHGFGARSRLAEGRRVHSKDPSRRRTRSVMPSTSSCGTCGFPEATSENFSVRVTVPAPTSASRCWSEISALAVGHAYFATATA